MTASHFALPLLLLAASSQAWAQPKDLLDDPLPDGALYRLGTTRLQHGIAVNNLRFSADGKKVISTSYHRDTSKVWDVATGKLLDTQPSAFFIASPDGKLLAGREKSSLVIKDAATNKQIYDLDSFKPVTWAFAKDSQTFIALDDHNVVRRFDVKTGKQQSQHSFALAERRSFGDPPVGLSQDGTVLAGVLREDAAKKKVVYPLRFWDTATGKEVRPPLKISSDLYRFQFSPDGKRILALLRPYEMEIWDVTTGKQIEPANGKPSGADHAAFAPDGRRILIGGVDQASLYDPDSGERVWRRKVAPYRRGWSQKVSMVATFGFHEGSKMIAVGCTCGYIALLDWTTGEPLGFTRSHPGFVGGPILFAPDGKSFLCEDLMGWACVLCDTATGKPVRQLGWNEKKPQWLPGSDRLIAYDYSKQDEWPVSAIDARTGKVIWRDKDVREFIVGPSGKTIALLHWNRLVRIVDAATGRPLQSYQLPGEAESPWVVDVAPDEGLFATASAREFQIWDMTGKLRWKWAAPKDWEDWSVRFLPGNKHVLVHSKFARNVEESAHVLELSSGKKSHSVAGPDWPGYDVAPDGRFIVYHTETPELREVATGRLIAQLPPGVSVEFAPDSSFVAVRAKEKLELRATATGALLKSVAGLPAGKLAIASDKRTFAITGGNSTLLIWRSP